MKKCFPAFVALLLSAAPVADTRAQCSVCTRTAQQMGEKSARGLNAGILYLAFTPLALFGGIGFWWWRKEKARRQ